MLTASASGASGVVTPSVTATGVAAAAEPRERWLQLALISVGILCAMSPSFASSSVAPLLRVEWGMDALGVSWVEVFPKHHPLHAHRQRRDDEGVHRPAGVPEHNLCRKAGDHERGILGEAADHRVERATVAGVTRRWDWREGPIHVVGALARHVEGDAAEAFAETLGPTRRGQVFAV